MMHSYKGGAIHLKRRLKEHRARILTGNRLPMGLFGGGGGDGGDVGARGVTAADVCTSAFSSLIV